MCSNCRSTVLHYSVHCGISTEIETAVKATMCPSCNIFIERIDACPSMTCERCKSKFCIACGRESTWTINCINRTYPAGMYENQNKLVIDSYFQRCSSALTTLLLDFNTKSSEITQKMLKFKTSFVLDIRRLAPLIEDGFRFLLWHQLLMNYILIENEISIQIMLEYYPLDIENQSCDLLEHIKKSHMKQLDDSYHHAQNGYSFLESDKILECIGELEKLLEIIKMQHELVRKLKTSSRIIIPK